MVDDLQQPACCRPSRKSQAQATATSPELKAAAAGVQQAGYDVTVARYQYLPSFGLDFFYGIDANQFARAHHSPDLRLDHPNYRQNLGYVAQATLNIPVWNWGATRSKIKQAELKRDQAQLDLTLAQRTLQSNWPRLRRGARGSRGNSIRCAAQSISPPRACA